MTQWIPTQNTWSQAMIITVNVREIYLYDHCQPRLNGINPDTVKEYAEAMEAYPEPGWRYFPMLRCVKTPDDLWLVSGFHRHQAILKSGYEKIDIEYIDGTIQDAIMLSKQENTDHGLRRTNADKEHVVRSCLLDDQLKQWSNEQIAKWCAVAPKTVKNVEVRLCKSQREYERSTTRKYLKPDGTIAEKNTAPIGIREQKPDTKDIQKGIVEGDSFINIATRNNTTITEVMRVSNEMKESAPRKDTLGQDKKDAIIKDIRHAISEGNGIVPADLIAKRHDVSLQTVSDLVFDFDDQTPAEQTPDTDAIRADIEKARRESDNGNGGGTNGVKYKPIAEKHAVSVEEVGNIALSKPVDHTPQKVPTPDITFSSITLSIDNPDPHKTYPHRLYFSPKADGDDEYFLTDIPAELLSELERLVEKTLAKETE